MIYQKDCRKINVTTQQWPAMQDWRSVQENGVVLHCRPREWYDWITMKKFRVAALIVVSCIAGRESDRTVGKKYLRAQRVNKLIKFE